MTNDDLEQTLGAVANQMQVLAGLTSELRRPIVAHVQLVAEVETAVDTIVRLLKQIQPQEKA